MFCVHVHQAPIPQYSVPALGICLSLWKGAFPCIGCTHESQLGLTHNFVCTFPCICHLLHLLIPHRIWNEHSNVYPIYPDVLLTNKSLERPALVWLSEAPFLASFQWSSWRYGQKTGNLLPVGQTPTSKEAGGQQSQVFSRVIFDTMRCCHSSAIYQKYHGELPGSITALMTPVNDVLPPPPPCNLTLLHFPGFLMDSKTCKAALLCDGGYFA